LILADGGRIHYSRIDGGAGNDFTVAVYEHTSTPTRFHKSRISWNGSGWDLKLKDATLYKFRDGFGATRPGQAGMIRIQDRNGNAHDITRDANGNVTKITSFPSGRWIEFTNDGSNRITQAKDNTGRTVSYTYFPSGQLQTVTDPNGGIWEYTYDTLSRMLTVKNPRGIIVTTNNEFDAAGKVTRQTLADGGLYTLVYTLDGNGKTIQTDVTDPRNIVRRVTFNTDGYSLSETRGLGAPEEQVTTYERQAGTNLLLSMTDALGRKTAYTYDSMGNVLTVTRLADMPNAVTTTFTYEPAFNQLKTITDALTHTTTFDYDTKGNLTTITDPLNKITTIVPNSAGQPSSVEDPLHHITQFTYTAGDLETATDPVGNLTRRFTDAAGRLRAVTNPLGNTALYDYDPLNRLTKVTDPLQGQTQFEYDANGNPKKVTDARSKITEYTYKTNADRLDTRKDPLLNVENYDSYDGNGNLLQFTDRKGQVTTYEYDALNRRKKVTYVADSSTTEYVYDAGNRLRQIIDSNSGTITRDYDDLDRLTLETTPQGSVSYTYDNAGRRTSMTVAGQPAVTYPVYDDANRLKQITQGTSNVLFDYDDAGRRTALTLPNGIQVQYGYDNASRVTSITYKLGTTTLGDLNYEYDKAGNRTKVGGTWTRTGIPQAISVTNYDDANRQLTFGDRTLTYDNNGNLTSIVDANGTTLYIWNARNQLTGLSGPAVGASFAYDGLARREQKTVNGSSTEFMFTGVNPVQETSGATVLANILTGLGIDEFLTRTDIVAGTTSYFLPDGLQSAVALTDTAGVVQTEYTYEPFGKTTATGVLSSNPFQYTSRENDDTGLYYYRTRYYHPELQRFVAEDPIAFIGTNDFYSSLDANSVHENYASFAGEMVNLYSYVMNRPVNYTDPSGMISVPAPLKRWACGYAKAYCCHLTRLECLGKLDLKTCPPEDIAKCDADYLSCLVNANLPKPVKQDPL
jgi:RHS repeat-associated protein